MRTPSLAASTTLTLALGLTACGSGDNHADGATPPSISSNGAHTTTVTDGTPVGSATTPVTPSTSACPETGTYACLTGSSEPLYTYQWALNALASFFKVFPGVFDGALDLNVEAVHTQGIKGQGVNVLVLDDGVDIHNEDLAPNVNRAMTHNFVDGSTDPTPVDVGSAHGTNVAGIIAAAQNGKGVMGIAPRVTLGGARFLGAQTASDLDAFGGAHWSKDAHVFNASFVSTPRAPLQAFDDKSPGDAASDTTIALRSMAQKMRGGLGSIFVKASGNDFLSLSGDRFCPADLRGVISCQIPAYDTTALEPEAIIVAAASAKGVRASYSNAGAVNWVTGLAGEQDSLGDYGEQAADAGDAGPQMYSTDRVGCTNGYARSGLDASFTSAFLRGEKANNPRCDYAYMNGTSAATPSVVGVVALMLQANPQLTWRDVRDILRQTARKIDAGYGDQKNRNHAYDLDGGTGFAATASPAIGVTDGATVARLDFGWVQNKAGYWHSNWYGFGLVDAGKAVQMAKDYAAGNFKSRPALLDIDEDQRPFTPLNTTPVTFDYARVTRIATFNNTATEHIDQFQINITGKACAGSVGYYVKSPQGTWSILSTPYNAWYGNSAEVDGSTGPDTYTGFGLGTYAFYGESARGVFEIYAVAGYPWNNQSTSQGKCETPAALDALKARVIALPATS